MDISITYFLVARQFLCVYGTKLELPSQMHANAMFHTYLETCMPKHEDKEESIENT